MHTDLAASRSDERAPVPRKLTWLRDFAARGEAPVLQDAQLAAWAGFRLGIFQAATIELAAHHSAHPAVAMMLRGRSRAQIVSLGDECDFCPGPDSVGVFGPHFEVTWSRWECEPGGERLMIELDFSDLERGGDLDAMLAPRRGLRQDLTLRDPQLAALMRLMADEVRRGSPHGALYASSLSVSLAAYLFAQHGDGTRSRRREPGGLTSAQKTRVLALIEQRLAENIRLDELAAAAGVSRFHFLRLFKNSLGVTPHRFVMDQRVAAARRLLEDTDLPLVDIATATGFSSQGHLCTAMRNRLGLSPGSWRRSGVS